MRYFSITKSGEIELHNSEIPLPEPDEALVEVKAIGVNRADLLQRKGLYPLVYQ